MKALYVSDDGKFFTTPEECMEYEAKLNGYVVEVEDEECGNFKQHLNNKQACQHFVANYVHQLLGSFETKEEMENFFYNNKITVYHKDDKETYLLIDLIEEVPAHYKINSGIFHSLIM